MMIEQYPLYYEKNKFFVTSRFNKLSKSLLLRGSDKIQIEGKTIVQS